MAAEEAEHILALAYDVARKGKQILEIYADNLETMLTDNAIEKSKQRVDTKLLNTMLEYVKGRPLDDKRKAMSYLVEEGYLTKTKAESLLAQWEAESVIQGTMGYVT